MGTRSDSMDHNKSTLERAGFGRRSLCILLDAASAHGCCGEGAETSAVDMPNSCSRKIPMICSSVNLDRFIVRSFLRIGL
jgi:hypothetical protein